MRLLGFLAFVTAALLLTLPAHAAGPNYCKAFKKATTLITVALDMPAPVFDFSKSIKDLSSVDRDRLDKEWATTPERKTWIERAVTTGLASGRQEYEPSVLLNGVSYSGYGDYCPFFKAINILITYKTTIYIAKDFPHDSCYFKSTVEHEFRHHRTNQRIVQKYIAMLKRDLPQMIDEMEAMGYVHYKVINQRFATMQQGMGDAIQIYNEDMDKEIDRDNAEIDTLEEYKSGSARCVDGVDTMADHDPHPLTPEEFAMIPGGYGGNPGPVAIATPGQEQTVVLKAAPMPDIRIKAPPRGPMPVIVPGRR